MTLPKINKIVIENFSLYKQKRRIELDVSDGVLCLAGANGLGKSTFISILCYAMTGTVVQPDIDFKSLGSIPAFVKKTVGFSDNYFDGRIEERDRDGAVVGVEFKLGRYEYRVKRSFFDSSELIDFSRIDDCGNETVNDGDSFLRQYVSFFAKDAGLDSFDQYIFLQTYVMTFDESKKLLFWDEDVMNRLMYLFFALNPGSAQKADGLRKNIKRYESNMRNIQWDISKMEKRLLILSNNGSITEEEAHQIEQACDSEAAISAAIEAEIQRQRGVDDSISEVKLKLDDSVLKQHGLKLQYDEVFATLYDKKVFVESNGRVQNALKKIIVCLTENETADISEQVSEMRQEIINAIHITRADHEQAKLEQLKSLDQQILKMKVIATELKDKYDRLIEAKTNSRATIDKLNDSLVQFRNENGSLLKKRDSIRMSEQTQQEIAALRTNIQERKREKLEIELKRNASQNELKPLEENVKSSFSAVSERFIPTFREYAKNFIGLDIDIELRDVNGMSSLVVNVNGSDRRSRFQLSESQQYFLDIALRFSLVEYTKSSNAFMLIDTPEGSLDIAYESRAGKMFADFVDKGYDVIMTANINTSQLLLKLAERCGKSKMRVERMTDWTILSQVQQEEQNIIEEAYEKIESRLIKKGID